MSWRLATRSPTSIAAPTHTKSAAVPTPPARRADAEARARRARFAVDSAERREYQARADAVLSLFGERAPESVADENSHGFRVQIARLLQNKLPRTDPLARMELLAIADDAAFNAIEGRLFAAARAEAETPSRENLPADGRLVERTFKDDTNGYTERRFYGRKTFLSDFAPPVRNYVRAFNVPAEMADWRRH